MNKIDWNKRIRNKWFWIPMLSALGIFGKSLGLFILPDDYEQQVMTLLTALVALGILVDPTTPGLEDSEE